MYEKCNVNRCITFWKTTFARMLKKKHSEYNIIHGDMIKKPLKNIDNSKKLNDIKAEFIKSREKEIKKNYGIYIYRYNKPNYNISCDEFYNYIFTQREIFDLKIASATLSDLERIKQYKLQTIMDYAYNISQEEKNKIENYICEIIPKLIKEYKNIIYNTKIVGSFLTRKITDGLLLDEIFIEKEYRNKGIGTEIIKKYILDSTNNIYLWIYKDNIKALKLYKQLGFKIEENTDSRYYMKYKNNIY